jgi:hypothetical protein
MGETNAGPSWLVSDCVLHGRLIRMMVCLCLLAALARPAVAQQFSDNFELDPFWSVFQQNGSIELSSAVSHSGIESVKLTSISGGQRNIWITHTFPPATRGTLSVWFYDTTPGVATLYSGLYAFDSGQPSNYFSVNVADWSASNYIWAGPGVNETPTSVLRTPGWHEFKLQVTAIGSTH